MFYTSKSDTKACTCLCNRLLNLTEGFTKDPFHVSEQANFIFVEQYLKFFMPKDEFKEMFKE